MTGVQTCALPILPVEEALSRLVPDSNRCVSLSIRHEQPQVGLRCFIWTTASMSSLPGPFGPGLPLRLHENSRRYFRFLRAWWMPKRVEGFSTIAELIRRAGRMKRAHTPATRRSEKHRWGDRCRERLRIRSCCLTRTDSATTEQKIGRAHV